MSDLPALAPGPWCLQVFHQFVLLVCDRAHAKLISVFRVKNERVNPAGFLHF